MDLLSLPDNFKLQIFKELDWKDLKNLKHVCRDLYLLIEKNIQSLDRPKVNNLRIFHDKDRIFRSEYGLKSTENTLRNVTLKTVEFSNNDEYENFLRDKDFTKIKRLLLKNVSNGGFIVVEDDSDSSEDAYIYDFHFVFPTETSSLFNNIRTRVFSTRELEIPYNSNLLREQSLRKWGIFEESELRLVAKKIIMDVLTGNPLLEHKNISTDFTKPIFIQITNRLYELGVFNLENVCNRKQYILFFHLTIKFNVLEQEFYSEFFDKIKFGKNLVVEISRIKYSIGNSIKCSKCDTKHENSLIYHKDIRGLEITLF
uniref:F-box domain-containing protein n=1 Tax=Strongyloides papillosus TaxID=174720 RepID=A0A0N5BKH6_STREA